MKIKEVKGNYWEDKTLYPVLAHRRFNPSVFGYSLVTKEQIVDMKYSGMIVRRVKKIPEGKKIYNWR